MFFDRGFKTLGAILAECLSKGFNYVSFTFVSCRLEGLDRGLQSTVVRDLPGELFGDFLVGYPMVSTLRVMNRGEAYAISFEGAFRSPDEIDSSHA
jgi:hypothetical protein